MPGWTRASELERTLICPTSLVLDAGLIGERSLLRLQKSQSTLEAAEWGRLVHLWKATGALGEQSPQRTTSRLSKLLSERSGTFTPDLRECLWPRSGGEHELTYALSASTWDLSVFRSPDEETRSQWKVSHSTETITGTADYVGSLFGVPWVDDLKTGRTAPDPENPQNLFYALCAWKDAGEPSEGAHVSITHWPRYPVAGLPVRHGPVLVGVPALLAFQERLGEAYQRFQAAQSGLDFYWPGEHCKYCPARNVCPTQNPEL